jgi:hypothetical protein
VHIIKFLDKSSTAVGASRISPTQSNWPPATVTPVGISAAWHPLHLSTLPPLKRFPAQNPVPVPKHLNFNNYLQHTAWQRGNHHIKYKLLIIDKAIRQKIQSPYENCLTQKPNNCIPTQSFSSRWCLLRKYYAKHIKFYQSLKLIQTPSHRAKINSQIKSISISWTCTHQYTH